MNKPKVIAFIESYYYYGYLINILIKKKRIILLSYEF